MFIHYCDGCNVRVDNDECVNVGEKVFCKACAEKAGVKSPGSGIRAPGSGLHGSGSGRPMSGGRPSGSGLHRSGIQSSGSAANARRSPPTGTRQVVTAARPAAARAGSSQMRSAVRGAPAADNSKLAVMSLAAAGVILAGLGLVLMMRGKPKPPTEPDKPDVANVDAQQPEKKTNPNEPVKTPVAPVNPPTMVKTDPKPVEAPAKPAAEVDMSDIREGAAMREWTRIVEAEKDPKTNPMELRRKYERFISSYRSTKPGKEAAEKLKAMPEMQQRPPDVADKAEPGIQAKIFEKTFGGETIGSNNLKDCKLVATKVLNEVNMPNKGALEATLGRGDNTAVQFTGFVEVPADGTYNFYTTSDDGSLLYIGDMLVANNDGSHGMNEVGDSVPMKKGKHRIRVDYCQGGGEAGVIISWSGPGVEKQPIPASALSHIND
jgi:hypothetical protein